MQVREIMTENPACCTPETSLREIAQMMVEHDCGCIPVVENQSSKKPVGTVTDRDITIRAFTMGENPLNLKASDVMTVGIKTVSPDSSIHECADVMEDNKIRRVLVVDEKGCCCGIVAQADIAESAPNPHLVSNVVQEISESEPTPNKGILNRMRKNKSYSPDRERSMYQSETRSESSGQKAGSLFSFNNLMPLLVGVGAGAAINYFYGNRQPKPISHNYPKSYGKSDQSRSELPKETNSSTVKTTEVTEREIIPSNRKENLESKPDYGHSFGQS